MKSGALLGDFLGGLGAMLVALPSAIAFGVTIFAPLGGSYAALGALAGILGTTALGLVAPAIGGAGRLITAPCAPAVAVLAAVGIEFAEGGLPPEAILLRLALIAAICGVLQIAFGLIGIGRLIKYMPYPVVSGYLTGVGLIIIASQVPQFLGLAESVSPWQALSVPSAWSGFAICVGLATVAAMLLAPKLGKGVPAAIVGLGAGLLAYFGLALAAPGLLRLDGNALVVGPFAGSAGDFLEALAARWRGVGGAALGDLSAVLVPGLTLAVLLSIDTLKTCVVLDALTRTRHDSNRVLIAQGAANLASTAVGGVPGAGQMGATLVNLSSGGQTRRSGLIEGVLALFAFLALGGLIAWVPIAALAGILIVIGVRMIDHHSFALLRNRSTVLDFAVIVVVVAVALGYSLIAASGVGVALAVLLFIREQIGGAVVRRKALGNQMFSKQIRVPEEMAILADRGEQTVIFELQGSLFFGTTDQLYTALEPELKTRRYVVLDMRRVQSVDITAAHMLEQVEDMLADRGAYLLFSDVPRNVPSGRDMQRYFDELGLARTTHHVRVFGELDDALAWIEDRTLTAAQLIRPQEQALELREMELFAGRKAETLAELEACMERRAVRAGETIFARGETGDELFLIRRGAVRILLPLTAQQHHLATFGRGSFFGEMSFLDRGERSADAVAYTDTDLFVLSRQRFDEVTAHHKRLAIQLLGNIARILALRLRYANAELRTLRDPTVG
jgi:SulP family sulfate permease